MTIEVKIRPKEYFCKMPQFDFIECEADICVKYNGIIYTRSFLCTNTSFTDFLSDIKLYLAEKKTDSGKRYYPGWMMSVGVFEADESGHFKTFCVEKAGKDGIEFTGVLDDECIISLCNQIEKQYSEYDWDSLGKVELYIFKLPKKDYSWCYSAKELNEILNKKCKGKALRAIYVTARNYADPLHVKKDCVNYWDDALVRIRTEDTLIDFCVFAEGLVKLCVFEKGEWEIIGPVTKFIENAREEMCDFSNGYGTIDAEYKDIEIAEVCVNATYYHPWKPNGFDKFRIGNPPELPDVVSFRLANGLTVYMRGLDDDFIIGHKLNSKIKP